MAVVTVSIFELKKLAGLEKDRAVEQLSDIGMPIDGEAGDDLFVEVTPNRPDLFSIEGIARVLNALNGRSVRNYSAKKSDFKLVVDRSVGAQRPYIVSAVLKNVNMNESVLKSMMQLQEKLHETVGRKRRKVAIGIHNADEVVFPLTYKFVKNESFVPLDFSEEMDVEQILARHPRGKAYAHLVGPHYPVLCDQKGVISFPPIINSERTRVTENTKNLVLDVTGTHLETLDRVLNILVCALADRGGEIYGVSSGRRSYPNLEWGRMPIKLKEISKLLGENFQKTKVLDCLSRMGWMVDGSGKLLVPPYRTDVNSYVDAAEDVAIAYGYDRLAPTLPDFFSIGKARRADDDVKDVMVGAGFVEVVNYALANYKKMEDVGGGKPLKIINPKTEEFTLLRTTLAGSLLENIALNANQEHPVKIFEMGRVFAPGKSMEETRLGFAVCSESVDFSLIRGVLQSVMWAKNAEFELKQEDSFGLFIHHRGAGIYYKNKKIGIMGEVAPETLEKSGISFPVGFCELDLGAFTYTPE
ncbi:MAG: phenylalanine--tRNA ligase subunit beta [Candidatus Micrarchaeia archaeon]